MLFHCVKRHDMNFFEYFRAIFMQIFPYSSSVCFLRTDHIYTNICFGQKHHMGILFCFLYCLQQIILFKFYFPIGENKFDHLVKVALQGLSFVKVSIQFIINLPIIDFI